MKSSVIQRVSALIAAKGMSSRSFASTIGFNYSTLNNYITGRRANVDIVLLEKIANSFGDINVSWLLTGNGNMVKSDEKVGAVSVSSKYPLKPFVDIANISYLMQNGFSISVNEKGFEYLSLPISTTYDFSIRAMGDSMVNRLRPEKSIKSGDIVACRVWKSRTHIRWGEVYALSTVDGVIIKKIEKSEKEGVILCVSHNVEENYLPYELPMSEVQEMALVVGVVSVVVWN